MAIENSVPDHDEQVARVMGVICTRTLNHFAEEAKLNGESLRDAFERYEIDYAWHVLGSERLRAETVSFLEARHCQTATEAQKARVAGILQSAARAQPPELLMSFDNEVPQRMAELLDTFWLSPPTTTDAAPAAQA